MEILCLVIMMRFWTSSALLYGKPFYYLLGNVDILFIYKISYKVYKISNKIYIRYLRKDIRYLIKDIRYLINFIRYLI